MPDLCELEWNKLDYKNSVLQLQFILKKTKVSDKITATVNAYNIYPGTVLIYLLKLLLINN